MSYSTLKQLVAVAFCIPLIAATGCGQSPVENTIREPLPQALSESESMRVMLAVDRGLAWLATQVENDGAFSTRMKNGGQPALTAFSVMAFLSRGHRPGAGPYGEILNRAIDFTLSCQKPSGFICYGDYDADRASRSSDSYNHAIALLMLGEVYGMTTGERSVRVRQVIEKGLAFTHQLWLGPKSPSEAGGWRYVHAKSESDLSVTGWYVASLRSLKNAGFDVPKEVMDQTSGYVDRCYSAQARGFVYRPFSASNSPSIAMTGAGVLSLALAGQTNHPHVLAGAETLARQGFHVNVPRCHYACYYATQAAAQVGGEIWQAVYRKVAQFILSRQQTNGVWLPIDEAGYGPVYSTSLAILALTPQFQLLPIYQH